MGEVLEIFSTDSNPKPAPPRPSLPPLLRAGTPPRRFGRPLPDHCQPNKDPEGNPSQFGQMDPRHIFGQDGWCKAAAPAATCTCLLDGVGGPTCDTRHEEFCPNQCNGHGDCNLGFCQCHEGWWGQDCANRRAGVPLTPGAILGGGGKACSRAPQRLAGD